jgi:hypothetical protein
VSVEGQEDSGQAALFSIEIVVPNTIKVNEDVALDLAIKRQKAIFSTSEYETSLKSGKEIQGRTSRPCNRKTTATSDATQTSCARGTYGTTIRWFVRSDKTGRSLIMMQLPQEIETELTKHAATWSAAVSLNGNAITKSVVDPNARQWSPGEYRVFYREIPVVLSASEPVLDREDIEIDLRSLEITLPLRVETTLGVSASTYALLTNGGALASAFLGGGWLWQLLAWLKERQGREDGLATPSRRRRKKGRARGRER